MLSIIVQTIQTFVDTPKKRIMDYNNIYETIIKEDSIKL